MFNLRDYQQKLISRLQTAWRKYRCVMVQMPTGTGKTVSLAKVISDFLAEGEVGQKRNRKGVLIVAHRRELLDQINATISSFDIPLSDSVVVESIQKLSKHIYEMEYSPSLIVIDEAHHALAKTYWMLWDRWPKAKFLGLTATPCRLDGSSFLDLFEVLVQSENIQWFISEGWLSDFEYISPTPDSAEMKRVGALEKRGVDGDYQTKEMSTVLDVPESIEHLYKTYNAYTPGKKGIVYAIDRQHAAHICSYYVSKGVRAVVIDATTPAKERESMVAEYSAGNIDVLVNVDIFSEGFDCPEVEFIQLARPTLSLSKYLQQVGRGMRISAGKPFVTILDNVGLYQTFGLPTVNRDWNKAFRGLEAGKGVQGLSRCVKVDDRVEAKKELVNLEMMHIKLCGQKGAGLEIFLQNGRYGVMRNGHIVCPAKFKRIERLPKESGFFALATYVKPEGWKVPEMWDVTTVIDKRGLDLGVELRGPVIWTGDFFYGENAYTSNAWDPVSKMYFDHYPTIAKVAGVEVIPAKEHFSNDIGCMALRVSTGKVTPRFLTSEMFYNRFIIIARDYLIIKKDHNHSYRIIGYLDDSIIVENDAQYGFLQFFTNGKPGEQMNKKPAGLSKVLDAKRLKLQRAVSKEDWEKGI